MGKVLRITGVVGKVLRITVIFLLLHHGGEADSFILFSTEVIRILVMGC